MNTKYALVRLTLFTLLALFAVAPPARAANANPPGKMTFQGFLTDASNPPVPLGNTTPANTTVIFKIYKSPTSAAAADVLWAESQVVTVDKGHFSVLLGEGSAVTGFTDKHPTDLSGVFIGADASDRWIGITVDGAEITPRIQFFAAPYAQLAKAANSLVNPSGQTIFNLANGTLEGTADMTVTGSVTSSGSGAGLLFGNRNGSGVWQWYTSDGTARLWNDNGAGSFGDRVAVSSDGKLGIGTTSPAEALDINGKLTISDGARTYPAGISTEVNSELLQFGINEGSGNRFGTANTAAQGGMFRFDTRSSEPVMSIFTRPASENSDAGAQRFAVLGNGNVGIGTTAPSAMLQIGEGANAGPGGVLINTGWVNPIDFAENRPLAVQVKGDSKLVVNTQGNVGIGTTSPGAKLDVQGGGATSPEFRPHWHD